MLCETNVLITFYSRIFLKQFVNHLYEYILCTVENCVIFTSRLELKIKQCRPKVTKF